MKRFGKVVLGFGFLLLLVAGCTNTMNTPTSKVEEFLGKYQSMDSDVATQLDQVISDDDTMNDDQKEILGDVINSTKYLQNLVGNILEKYKGDNGKVVITKSLNSFKKLVSECCDEVKYIAPEKNLRINVSYKSKIDNIYFDYDEIKRVMHNLLTNGIKYSFKNEEIKVNVVNDSQNLIFSVSNIGISLDMNKIGNVFEKFTSYCEEQKSVNAGLGLYISKQIIDAHGGEISFESTPDGKTTVTFTLPANLNA